MYLPHVTPYLLFSDEQIVRKMRHYFPVINHTLSCLKPLILRNVQETYFVIKSNLLQDFQKNYRISKENIIAEKPHSCCFNTDVIGL